MFSQLFAAHQPVSTSDPLLFDQYSMRVTPAVKQYSFYSYPTYGVRWNESSNTGTDLRTFVKISNPNWPEKLNASTFTPWESCTDTARQTYFSTFGNDAEIPLGYTSSPFGTCCFRHPISRDR